MQMTRLQSGFQVFIQSIWLQLLNDYHIHQNKLPLTKSTTHLIHEVLGCHVLQNAAESFKEAVTTAYQSETLFVKTL